MKRVTCRCGATADIPCENRSPSIREILAFGWGFAWDVGYGLVAIPMCGACARRVADLAAQIEAIVGSDMLSFTQLLTADGRDRPKL